MCGRYFLKLTPQRLHEFFSASNFVDFSPFSNACPTQFLPIVVQGKENCCRAGLARWGVLPSHASHDDKALSLKLKNARSETVREKKSFADLWDKGRRCFVPASGFYEWPEEKIKGHPAYEISMEREAFGFAGLWNKRDDLVTFTILTKAAAPDLQPVHSRMPVMFEAGQMDEWFKGSAENALRMMERDAISSGFKINLQEKPILQNGQPVLV